MYPAANPEREKLAQLLGILSLVISGAKVLPMTWPR